jgi:hypothetical protein
VSSYAYVGAVAPESISVEVLTADAFDLSTVTAATLEVRYPGPAGATRSWTCTLSDQSATALTVTHLYDVGDLEVAGTYSAYVSMTTPSGTIRSVPKTFRVRELFT